MEDCSKENKLAGTSRCSIGISLQDICHETHYTKRRGIKEINQLSDEERELLYLRLNGRFNTVCLHHEQVYIHKYTHLFGRICCDPYKRHKKRVQKSLRVITVDRAKASEGLLLPGKKICPTCDTLQKTSNDTLSDTVDTSEFRDLNTECEKLNNSLYELGETPVKKVKKLSYKQRQGYSKRKLKKIVTTAKLNLANALNIEPTKIDFPIINNNNTNDLNDFQCLLDELKVKFTETTSYADKIQILTLVPNSWSLEKICSEFSTTKYLARKARQIKRQHGILGKPTAKQGNRVSKETSDIVQTFYESDDLSRICPGKKDYITIRTNDGKTQKQKRLVLCNLKEAHIQFKEQYNNVKIGFSTFAAMRPKWCVLAGSSGTHSVCVCTIHQNMKLMLQAIKPHLSLLNIMELYVCNTESEKCMLGQCDQCPKIDEFRCKLKEFDIFSRADEIVYRQWTTTDRSTLITQLQPVDEFIISFTEKMSFLNKHHFIAKSQSKYLQHIKTTISQEECIVLLDFSENYAFIVQDAIQGFHWENTQATLHPFVVYGKSDNDALNVLSICVISDHVVHDTATVFAFQKVVIPFVKETFPSEKNYIL